MGFEQFSSRYVLYVPSQWSLSVYVCVCVSVCPSLSQRRGSCRRLLEVPHRNTRIRHRKVNRRLLLTHSCPYRNGGLCSSSQNKRVLRNTDCCCLALTIGSAPPPGGNQCSVWEGSRSQPQHGFLSLFPCAFPHLPLEHCLLCFGCILRGDECCTGGSSSSGWFCLTFSGVWSGPAELGQALVCGMLLWPQLQPCLSPALGYGSGRSACMQGHPWCQQKELPWGWAGLSTASFPFQKHTLQSPCQMSHLCSPWSLLVPCR